MIQLFVTGGTFDKDYDYISGRLVFGETHVNKMLERGRCTVPYQVRTLMMLDSLDMTDADRELIAYSVETSPEDWIVITHGSDTITQTAGFLAKRDLSGKTVVLTAAMVPYAFGTSSDGFFNLGAAVSFVQTLKPGVYIAINGQAFDHDEVRKNRSTGFFERINPA